MRLGSIYPSLLNGYRGILPFIAQLKWLLSCTIDILLSTLLLLQRRGHVLTLEFRIKQMKSFSVLEVHPSYIFFSPNKFQTSSNLHSFIRNYYCIWNFKVAQLNQYEKAPNFIQLNQNLTWDCLN